MNPHRPGFVARLRRKFLLERAGYGWPLTAAVVDAERRDGAWDFRQPSELPRQQAVVNYLRERPACPAILDLGCGCDQLTNLLQAHRFSRYLGMGLSAEGLRRARALGWQGCAFVEGDFETWRPAVRFDIIVFSERVGYARASGALVAAFLFWLGADEALVVSYYRSGHWSALWKRIERHARVIRATTVTGAQAQTRDIKRLAPLPAP